MASLAKQLNEGYEVIITTDAGSPTEIIVHAANKRTLIDCITLCNYNNTAVGVDLWLVRNDAGNKRGVADDYRIFDRQHLSLAAGESLLMGPDEIKLVMRGTNDLLLAAASVASKIAILVFGFEYDTS